jgi:hypothetical protein
MTVLTYLVDQCALGTRAGHMCYYKSRYGSNKRHINTCKRYDVAYIDTLGTSEKGFGEEVWTLACTLESGA